jgi:hypothetical protein
MGKYVVFVHASAESESGKMPTTEEFKEMGAFNEELVKAGVMVTGEGLQRSAQAKRVTYNTSGSDGVENGPFPLDNLVAGYWVLKLNSMEEAVEWMKKAPFKEGSVTIRKVMDEEDFGAELTPELKAQSDELRKKMEGQ